MFPDGAKVLASFFLINATQMASGEGSHGSIDPLTIFQGKIALIPATVNAQCLPPAWQ